MSAKALSTTQGSHATYSQQERKIDVPVKNSLTNFVLGTAQNTEVVNKQDTRGKQSALAHSILKKPRGMAEMEIIEFSITLYTSLKRRCSVGQGKCSKEE